MILLMAEEILQHQGFKDDDYPIIHRLSYIPGGWPWGF